MGSELSVLLSPLRAQPPATAMFENAASTIKAIHNSSAKKSDVRMTLHRVEPICLETLSRSDLAL
jgi:hypothetical protein